jgi:hypothetical protein
MKNGKKCVLFAMIVSIGGAVFCSAGTAAVTFGDISVSPSSPTPQATITVSVSLSGDTPSEVRVRVEECNGKTGICFSDAQNVSMSLVSAGSYQTSVTLKHADATYINCTVMAQMNGSWITSANWKKVTLSETPNGDGGNGNHTTPGFELVLIMVATGVSLIVIRRQRDK